MSNFGNSSAKVSVANKISNDTSVDINSAAIVYKGFGETIRALMEWYFSSNWEDGNPTVIFLFFKVNNGSTRWNLFKINNKKSVMT